MIMLPESALTKPDVGESQRIRLTSPLVHIGSAVPRLSPFEYVQTARRLYIPNQEALARALLQRGRLQDFNEAIASHQDITPILEQAFGEEWQTIKALDGSPIFPRLMSSLKWTDQRITELRPIIRNGFGYPYIPGSSIKGAIRTAIAYHLLKHADKYKVPQQDRVSEIEKTLREKLKSGSLNKFQQKTMDDGLFMESLFSDFSLTYQDKSVNARPGPNTDFMRAIRVSDSEPLLEEKVTTAKGGVRFDNLSVVAEVIVSSRFPDYKAKYRASIYTEMVRNVNASFTLSLDTKLLSWLKHNGGMKLPFQDIADILAICQEFAQDQWDYEHDYWQDIQNNPKAQGKNLDFNSIRDIYASEKCPFGLRLGWGSGLNGTTVDLLIEDDLRAELRDTCGIKAPGFEAPKSRRTVMSKNNEIKFVPGWVKLQTS
jgi:CRISPR-associated protein Csm5